MIVGCIFPRRGVTERLLQGHVGHVYCIIKYVEL